MYKLFTGSCQLQLHLVKVVVRINMHASVLLAQTRSCIIPQCQVIATQIASCTRTVDSTWHMMSLTAATTSATSLAWSLATTTDNINQTARNSGTGVKRRWWKPALHEWFPFLPGVEIVVPSGWPYMAVKNRQLVSISSASVAFSSTQHLIMSSTFSCLQYVQNTDLTLV